MCSSDLKLQHSQGDKWLECAVKAAWDKFLSLWTAEGQSSMEIEEFLETLGTYYTVKSIKPWSPVQDYKCTCPDCHKHCVCKHCVLFSYLVNNNVVVPPQYVNSKVLQRNVQRRGRPSLIREQPARASAPMPITHVGTAGADEDVDDEDYSDDGRGVGVSREMGELPSDGDEDFEEEVEGSRRRTKRQARLETTSTPTASLVSPPPPPWPSLVLTTWCVQAERQIGRAHV